VEQSIRRSVTRDSLIMGPRKFRAYLLKVNFQRRIIWFHGEINENSHKEIIKALRRLNKTIDTIFFYFSGPGGSFVSCLEIGKAIANSRSPVIGIAHGRVQSACFLLSQFFKVCVGVSGTKFEFHHTFLDDMEGTLTQNEAREYLGYMQTGDASQFLIFARRAKDVNRLECLFEKQAILDLKQTKRLGLIDGVLNKKEFLADKLMMTKRR
jgi:ATP-dependent protease ClpP protease subunit